MAQRQDTLRNEDIQGVLIDDPGFLREVAEIALQRLLDAQFEASIGAGHYERNEERRGYRNGSYTRQLTTRVGQIELRVPRDRDGHFCPTLFRSFERYERAFQLALSEMVLQGVSTRKVADVVEALCGELPSKSMVSELAQEVMEEVHHWLKRPLPEKLACLLLDATYVKVREGGRVVSRAVLIAMAVHESGEREVIATEVADKESHAFWGDFIKGLASRGLRSVAWVVSDHHEGLIRAIQEHLQGCTWQRCQVHFMRNWIARLPKQESAKWMSRLKDIFGSPTREEAERRLAQLAHELHALGRTALADWLEENIGECLNVLLLPEHLRKRCASTNALERLNQEIKRRTSIARIYPNREALLRLTGCLCEHLSEKWAGRNYLPAQEIIMALAKAA